MFDVSDAGDTVIAAFSAAVATGADWRAAAMLANAAAGIVVAEAGTAGPGGRTFFCDRPCQRCRET